MFWENANEEAWGLGFLHRCTRRGLIGLHHALAQTLYVDAELVRRDFVVVIG